METLFIVLLTWAEASVGMKILGVLATIAFFVLFVVVPSGEWNPITREFIPNLGCGAKIVISIICVAIIFIFLQLVG